MHVYGLLENWPNPAPEGTDEAGNAPRPKPTNPNNAGSNGDARSANFAILPSSSGPNATPSPLQSQQAGSPILGDQLYSAVRTRPFLLVGRRVARKPFLPRGLF